MGDKKKVSSKLVLLGGIRKFAMPSRSFSQGTVNVSRIRIAIFNEVSV